MVKFFVQDLMPPMALDAMNIKETGYGVTF